MSKLEELIAELCPDGVEYKPLWSVTIWDKNFNSVDRKKQPQVISYNYLLAADLFALLQENGNVFLLSTGEQTGWTTEELAGNNIHEGEVITIPWGKSRAVTDCIKYYKGKFITADNRIMTSNDSSVLHNKYLYYLIMSMGKLIDTFYRGSGIKHPDMAKVLDLKIPVPPLQVQSEIVRILDNFTELTAELTAELTSRKKQYEYYSNQVFLRAGENSGWKSVGDVIMSLKTGLNPRQNFKLNVGGSLPYITGKDIFGNRINVSERTDKITEDALYLINKRAQLEKGDVLFASTGTGTVGRMAVIEDYQNDWGISETLYAMKTKSDIINPLYLMYVLYSPSSKNQFEPKISKGSVPHLKVADLLKVSIPVPSINEQMQIVSLVKCFDTLCNDISTGLPAEIEARTKQYEYYSDKLLTFKELS